MTDRATLEALSSHELHDRAVRRAMHHLDVGFLWEVLRAIPAGEAASGHADHTAADITQVSAMISDALGSGEGDVGEAWRPLSLDYRKKQGDGRASSGPGRQFQPVWAVEWPGMTHILLCPVLLASVRAASAAPIRSASVSLN